jgi:hypothetical protein
LLPKRPPKLWVIDHHGTNQPPPMMTEDATRAMESPAPQQPGPPPPTHTSLIDEAARFDRYGPPSSVGDAAPHASLDLRDTREGEGPATTFLGHTPPELP